MGFEGMSSCSLTRPKPSTSSKSSFITLFFKTSAALFADPYQTEHLTLHLIPHRSITMPLHHIMPVPTTPSFEHAKTPTLHRITTFLKDSVTLEDSMQAARRDGFVNKYASDQARPDGARVQPDQVTEFWARYGKHSEGGRKSDYSTEIGVDEMEVGLGIGKRRVGEWIGKGEGWRRLG
jgi:hypothetical protein